MSTTVAEDSTRSPPSFLVIVVDGGRASDFPDGTTPVRMPFCERLRQESITFPRAVAVSPWTIPSHASLFTGLYPWEHGVHLKSDLKLPADVPRLATLLRAHGYRTFSASANGFLCPDLGLTDGFDSAAWGDWWERYLRFPWRDDPPHASNYEPVRNGHNGRARRGDEMMKQIAPYSHRFPALLDGANRVAQRIFSPDRVDRGAAVSPWIEPTVATWLERQPADAPVFVFVNLMEAHEPFLGDPAIGTNFSAWMRMLPVRMDRFSYITGRWKATPAEMDRLHGLYRSMLRFIDSRVERLVGAFRAAGRWDNTTLVLAGDHGQAFGEHHHLYHGLLLHEPILRVPLWLRPPGGTGRGRAAQGWASLVDVAPTLLADAGAANTGTPSAVSLHSLVDAPRPGPVFAMADGITPTNPLRRLGTPEQRAHYDRVWVAAYEGDHKVVVDMTGTSVSAFDIAHDPGETNDLWRSSPAQMAGLAEAARSVGRQILHQPQRVSTPDVEERLASWGY